jgi:predicted RecB family endonuclease
MEKGMEVCEIDLIVQNDNSTYAVEMKAGRADVGSVRQDISKL